jgi:glyoxylase-like metal-dependent hydrolase (beta-lactamase superfamily II)
MNADIKAYFDPATFTYSYIVVDPSSKQAAIIDPVLDFDPASGKITTTSADHLVEHVAREGLQVDYILETHVHADHLTAAQYLQRKVGGKVGIGSAVTRVQETFGPLFNAGDGFAMDGSQFDVLFDDGATFKVGAIEFSVLHTPGHTPACVTYVIDGAAFVGDTIFMPDYGTARTDFPGGDAATLFDSLQRILSLPADTRLFMCHDYLPTGRDEYSHETTVAAEKAANVHLANRTKAQFVHDREAKDKTLAAPRLLLPSIQVNMRAGDLPPAESNEVRYAKIPLKVEME